MLLLYLQADDVKVLVLMLKRGHKTGTLIRKMNDDTYYL